MSRVRDLRVRLKLNQTGLAQRAGVAQSVVSRAEAGQTISDESIARLADALGVEPAELELNGSGAESAPPSSNLDVSVIPTLRNKVGYEDVLTRAKEIEADATEEDWQVLERAPGLLAFDVPLTPALLADLVRVVRKHRGPRTPKT